MDDEILLHYDQAYNDYHARVIPYQGFDTVLPGVHGDRDCCYWIYKALERLYCKGMMLSRADIHAVAKLADPYFSEYEPDRFLDLYSSLDKEEQDQLLKDLHAM